MQDGTYRLVDEALEEELADPGSRAKWLLLADHPQFPGYWIVESFANDFLFDFEGLLGSYRALAPAGLQSFLEASGGLGYQVAFFEDPTQALDRYKALNTPPEIEINSSFPETINGMLPFQVQGYNMLKDLEYGASVWSTGTGKTVLTAAIVKHHLDQQNFNLCLLVVKPNNRINTVRKLERFVGIEAICVRGAAERRARTYAQIAERLPDRNTVVVMNYEPFRFDFTKREKKKLVLSEWGEALFPGQDLLIFYDEMPTKLRTRTTLLYKSVCKCLYRTAPPRVDYKMLRPKSLRSYMLSATPIENSPEDFFNATRLLDGGRTYGKVEEFESTYVSSWNHWNPDKPETFHNLERMRLKSGEFVHQVNKSDPDVAKYFPEEIEEPIYVEWDEAHSAVYNEIQDLVEIVLKDQVPTFSLLGVLLMMCDAPEMIIDSGLRRQVYYEMLTEDEDMDEWGSEFAMLLFEHLGKKLTNENHPKLEKLREVLEENAESQVVLFSRFNSIIMPYLEKALESWGVSYGAYRGSEKQRQRVQDAFQAEEIRVFLSSDMGSDSIDLDAGNVVIDYDLPWKWTTLTQRHSRVHRPTSKHETVYYYSLIMEGSMEERVLQIIERKKGYHNELFDPAAGDLSSSARMTKEELIWVLTGRGV